jgi:hypothetical protein
LFVFFLKQCNPASQPATSQVAADGVASLYLGTMFMGVIGTCS